MKTVEVKIRLPEDIHAQLKELAAKEGRSMNKQITWALVNYISCMNGPKAYYSGDKYNPLDNTSIKVE